MKFIHLADVHFDTPLLSLRNRRELIKQRRTEYKQVFKDVISLAKDEDVNFLFISGDLFEQKFVQKSTIEFIISSFQLIPDTHIFISPGNHDPFIKSSPYLNYKFPDNVILFDGHLKKYEFEDVNIYGIGFDNYEFNSDEISTLEIDEKDKNKINVLVTHGTLNGSNKKYHDIKAKDLEKFDYVALGHIHDKKVDDTKIIYPGSLLSLGFDELGEHGIVIGDLEKDNITYEFKNMEMRHFVENKIDISSFKSPDEILNNINFEDNYYRVVLEGNRNVSTDKIKELLFIKEEKLCQVKDLTHVAYDFETISKEQNLKGYFTKKMLEELDKHPENKEEIIKAIEITYDMM